MAGTVKGYDEVMKKVEDFVKVSDKIGGDVKTQGKLAKEAFEAQRDFIVQASGRGKPSQDDLGKMLKPTSDKMAKVEQFQADHRASAHFKSISEAVTALGWVALPGKPSKNVRDVIESTEVYTNRVLRDFPKKDNPVHGEWVEALIAVLTGLKSYVEAHHSNALTWGK